MKALIPFLVCWCLLYQSLSAQQTVDSLCQQVFISTDSLSASTLKSRVDSLQEQFASRADSLQQSYAEVLSPLQQRSNVLLSKIDSANNSGISTEKFQSELDSLASAQRQISERYQQQLSALKEKTGFSFERIQLSPELHGQETAFAGQLNDVGISYPEDLNVPRVDKLPVSDPGVVEGSKILKANIPDADVPLVSEVSSVAILAVRALSAEVPSIEQPAVRIQWR